MTSREQTVRECWAGGRKDHWSGWTRGPRAQLTTLGPPPGVDRKILRARSFAPTQRYGLCKDRPLATHSGEGAGLEWPVCRGRALSNGPLAAAADNVEIVRTRAHVARVFGGRRRPASRSAPARRSWTPLWAADRHGCGVLPQPARGPCTCGWRDEARRLSLMRAGGRRAGHAFYEAAPRRRASGGSSPAAGRKDQAAGTLGPSNYVEYYVEYFVERTTVVWIGRTTGQMRADIVGHVGLLGFSTSREQRKYTGCLYGFEARILTHVAFGTNTVRKCDNPACARKRAAVLYGLCLRESVRL
jgi:hypothetical protein